MPQLEEDKAEASIGQAAYQMLAVTPRTPPRRVYIVEDSGVGKAAVDPVACFRLMREAEGAAIFGHLGTHPTLTMESYRGIPLAL